MKGPSPICKLVHAAGQRYTMVSRRKGCPLPSQTKQAGFLDEGSTCEESLTSSRRTHMLTKEPNTTQILDRLQRKLILLIHLLLNKLFSQISNCTPLNLTKQIIQKTHPLKQRLSLPLLLCRGSVMLIPTLVSKFTPALVCETDAGFCFCLGGFWVCF